MQKGTAVGETLIAKAASEGVVLTVLSHLNNGQIEEALAGFAEEFRFEDHGMGLEFKDKERLAEFFYRTRELYPDSFLQTDTIFVSGNRVIKLRQRSSHCLCSICAPRRGQLKDRNQAGGSHRLVAGPKRIEINVSIVVSDARKETFNLEQWLLDSTDPGGTLLTRLSE